MEADVHSWVVALEVFKDRPVKCKISLKALETDEPRAWSARGADTPRPLPLQRFLDGSGTHAGRFPWGSLAKAVAQHTN